MDAETEEKLLAQSLLRASARHDVPAIRNLLRSNVSANVQDAETGFTPLHAAVAACGTYEVDDAASKTILDDDSGERSSKIRKVTGAKEETAVETVKLLLQNGAIWNDLDKNDETPGCIANRLGLREVYQLFVDAGVRAELLLARLDAIQPAEEEDVEDGADDAAENPPENLEHDSQPTTTNEEKISEKVTEKEEVAHAPAANGTENGSATTEPPEDYIDHWDSNADFLRSSLRFTDTQLLDSSSNAVMMDWETEIMKRHAERLLPKPGLRAMNIGHGMGIVDTAIQSHEPAEHHIVEAHPAVLAQMRKNGWLDKPGVTVHEGRWQDVLPKLIEKGVVLDAIYYDTFAEDYKDLKELFSEHVIGLLDPAGKFGFYNGLGADRQVCYDVYTRVSHNVAQSRPIMQYLKRTGR